MTTQVSALKKIKKLTTPQWFKIGLYATWSASLLVLLSAIFGIQTQRHGIQAVAEDAIPDVIQAQRLKTAMTDIDSMIANQLLESSATLSPADQEIFDQRRQDLAERIVLAAQNISLGEAEQAPLQSLVLNFNDYMAQVERARFAKERGDQIAMLGAYRRATQILDETLIPNADEFARVNEEALEKSYDQARAAANLSLGFIALSGLLLLSTLIALQLFLSQRTRRTFNPMLVGATTVAVLFLAHTLALMSSSEQLRLLKEDAYGSLRALRLGRVHLYQANGFKSRYLLDSALSTQHETAFYQQTEQILKLPDSTSIEQVINAYKNGQQIPGLTGEFANALNNISFPGEREILTTMMENYAQYLQINRQIRQFATSDQKQAAIRLSTGRNTGQASWAFDELRDANEKAVDINTKAFNQIKTETFQSLSGFEIKATTGIILIALLILFGLRPRLKEYFF